MEKVYDLGIDIGSTTSKLVLTDGDEIVYKQYKRHLSRVRETTLAMLNGMKESLGGIDGGTKVRVTLSGSAGLGAANAAGLPFIQEVYSTGLVVEKYEKDISVVIELGGEDAKVIFYGGGVDERMNGTCAGGTGAFIDQMAVLLGMTADEMDEISLRAKKIYPIASRCGVFAKSDIQPLLNQGASKADVAASIYQAVVNQTIAGLVQGRKIDGKVLFLGGPLYYNEGLQKRFTETLKLSPDKAIFPSYALYSVAMGAVLSARNTDILSLGDVIDKIEASKASEGRFDRLPPLFENKTEYEEFSARHARAVVRHKPIEEYSGDAYLGIDCGSTTTKLVLISKDNEILYSYYDSNKGDPSSVVKDELIKILGLCSDRITICGSAVTGYGEELILHAFSIDTGVVETVAHYTAARTFDPDVDFILDIGGQDIKCFKVRNGAIDSIILNEACSSGCGSFLETFAKSLGYTAQEFAKLGLFARNPVDLGSRCTVFMNSSVKQSQKDGASVEDISAGLSVSVVRNAIYKVIRASSPDDLGKNVVVQGGTFYNDAVLRAFEREMGRNVIRPSVAGLMGAYGAALYSKKFKKSNIKSIEELKNFTHTSKSVVCKGCSNGCHLTVNTFSDGKKFITGNQCQKGLGIQAKEEIPNVYKWKREYLESISHTDGTRGRIGIPAALSTLELAPLWRAFFSSLGFEVCFSALSKRSTYEKGQFTIPSDTACYPAKIMHGHVLELIENGCETVFYPGLTFNVDEKMSDNHYNCPVVAYYGEVLRGNMEALDKINFFSPYLNIDSPRSLAKSFMLHKDALDPSITKREAAKAAKYAFDEYAKYKKRLAEEGEKALRCAREKGIRTVILAGRPYHIDNEIGHGIDKLITSLGLAVVSEDSVCHLEGTQYVNVLDQWTFHSRLYRAAAFAAKQSDVELVQLVSFGCGVDAITTDEVRSILERNGKYYTQIKIDEITNLGAVKIRIRSLLGALEQKEAENAK